MKRDAIGLIETRGLVAAVEAVDACLKAANVKFTSFRYTRGGLVCIIVNGDVGAVRAAVDAGSAAAAKIGEVVGIHVIPRPAEGTVNIIDELVPTSIDAGEEKPSLEGPETESTVEDEEVKDEEVDVKEEEDVEEDTAEVSEGAKADEVEEVHEEEDEDEEDEDEDEEDEDEDEEDEDEDEDEENEEDDSLSEDDLFMAVLMLREILEGKEEAELLDEDKGLDKYSVKIIRRVMRVLPLEDIDKSEIYTMRKKELLDYLVNFTVKEGEDSGNDEIR